MQSPVNQNNMFQSDVLDRLTDRMAPEVTQNGSLGSVPAGYTYWGQFISHEMVQSTSSPERTVKPNLMLDSLYGQNTLEFLYTNDGLFRERSNYANFPETRNAENILVAEFHKLWERVHNKIVVNYCDHLKVSEKANVARILVIKLFNKLVIEDYLEQMLNEDIYLFYKNNNRQLLPHGSRLSAVPLEFSHAVFRIGHSMVRPEYELQQGKGTKNLGNLMIPKTQREVLQPSNVNWHQFFFKLNSPTVISKQFASSIDTIISFGMTSIPRDKIKNIIKINLLADQQGELDSPQNILTKLQQNHKLGGLFSNYTLPAYRHDREIQTILGKSIMEWPLWLFVLTESQLLQDGNKFGKIASVVVAETIYFESIYTLNGLQDNQSIYQRLHQDIAAQSSFKMYDLISWL